MASAVLAATNSKTLWYLTRGTGVVTLVLLTTSLVLGVLQVNRWRSRRWPRFVTGALHKNISLLVVAFLAVHITTAVADKYAPISWLNVIVPFTSSYRPIWLGLGAVAFDLLLAVIVTSALRPHISHRAWRAVHWVTYALWPVAFVHGLGTGSDIRTRWVLALNLLCLAVAVGAVWWRLITGWPQQAAVRICAAGASVIAPLAILGWLTAGPLQTGWAVRAGTPVTLLGNQSNPTAGTATIPVYGIRDEGTGQ